MRTKEIHVPDIGDFQGVEIIDIAVAPGDRIHKESVLITLESDKASMDIPSPVDGVVRAIAVKAGDTVAQGDLILSYEPLAGDAGPTTVATKTAEDNAEQTPSGHADKHCEVLVLGGGPGGYTAAFRAADLGKKVILVERYDTLGGVCLNVGCIPSKALLHVAALINEIDDLKARGLDLGKPRVDSRALRQYAVTAVDRLTRGLEQMAARRGVEIVRGHGSFISPRQLQVTSAAGGVTLSFEHAVIAAGSQAAASGVFPDDPRIMDSTAALLLDKVPDRLLIVGGGVIGLEMATVYQALGSRITIVETLDDVLAECDADVARPLLQRLKRRYENIHTGAAVSAVDNTGDKLLRVTFEGGKAPASDAFDAVLLAIGRTPNGDKIGAQNAGVRVDEAGFIPVDEQQRTNCPHIFAVGDIVGAPMLAHKATHEGKLAAEVIAGYKHGFENRVIPSVAYTDPEIAWVGVTEQQAQAQGIDYGKGVFPWSASGRALASARVDGVSKLLFERSSKRLIGAAICGVNAGELIGECALAIEMGAEAEDIALTIHPHPTLSETTALASEMFTETITDLYLPQKK